jgi:predicted nucleic acid-binding protein
MNDSLQILLEETVDPGEASATALAVETKDSLLILDDLRARKMETALGLKITGTLGIIAAAKKQELLKMRDPFMNR